MTSFLSSNLVSAACSSTDTVNAFALRGARNDQKIGCVGDRHAHSQSLLKFPEGHLIFCPAVLALTPSQLLEQLDQKRRRQNPALR